MQLAVTDLFLAKWSDVIHDEWIRNLLKNRPDLTAEQLAWTRGRMNAHVPDALVTGFEDLIPSLTLPDPDDRHVLAAAIHGRADVIVTKNLKHFPASTLARYGIEPQHPDEFVVQLLSLAPDIVCEAVQTHRLGLRRPPKSIDEYLATVEQQEMPRTVAALRQFTDRL
jgi:hypothetical protein